MRIAIQQPDANKFSRALLSVLAEGHTPVLLPNFQSGTLLALTAEYDQLITSVEQDKHVSLNDIHPEAELIVFTSGSTGDAKKIIKKWRHLVGEVKILDRLLSDCSSEAVVYATVSPQHIYGLLFSVLWPLYSSRALGSQLISFPEQLANLDQLHQEYVLISSPSFLARLDANLGAGRNCRLVTSSGGALSVEAAEKVATALGHWPTEFFGSSETGGVAWRKQGPANPEGTWTCLPGVTVKPQAEGLAVTSNFFAESFLNMADRVEILDAQHFHHLGRSDRIAKIEGKRISLSEVESRLMACPWVKEAVAIALTTFRDQVACLVQLSPAGDLELESKGPLDLKNQLRAYLTQYFEAVTVPKQFRFVQILPRNAQGKIELQTVQALFQSERRPQILDVKVTGHSATFQLVARQELEYFRGHFPGFSLLPGVAQVHWAIAYAKEHLGLTGDFTELEVIKFMRPILPDALVELNLTYQPERRRLDFCYQTDTDKHSSGRILFRDAVNGI